MGCLKKILIMIIYVSATFKSRNIPEEKVQAVHEIIAIVDLNF
jgi:hypothetical protein